MTDDIMIELQRGFEFYYEAQEEFEWRGYPIDKQVAIAYEAGFQAGKSEIKSIFSAGNLREWA